MPDQIILYALLGAVSGLATVLWWLGRKTVTKLESVDAKVSAMSTKVNDSLSALKQSVTEDISALRVSVATDLGNMKERLAHLEGQVRAGK